METNNMVARIWHFLTRPHATITDIEQRRQSQLLAGLMVIQTVLSLVSSIVLLIRAYEGIMSSVVGLWIGMFIGIGAYLLNRHGQYRASAYVFVVVNFLLVHAAPIFTDELTWLLYGGMMLVIAAILLPPVQTVIVFVLSIIAQALLDPVYPQQTYITTFVTLMIFIFTGAMILTFIYHRAGIERERRVELQAANQKLRESEAALEQRVEARTRELQLAKEEAEAARKRAETADQIKSQFLANMSHELRTPLNAILNFTEFVTLEMLGPVNERQKDVLSKSLESGRHLHALINDVLDITKIDAGMMKLFVEPEVNLHALLPGVIATTQTLLHEKPITLISDIDADLPMLIGDSRRIRQMLLNLLSNAAKFTEQGSITVSVKNRADHVLFCVSDTGIGIAADEQKEIFEPFRQAHNARIHSEAGTGLGLPISRWLINAHGGKLWLESEVGEGSSFYFTLPALTNARVSHMEHNNLQTTGI